MAELILGKHGRGPAFNTITTESVERQKIAKEAEARRRRAAEQAEASRLERQNAPFPRIHLPMKPKPPSKALKFVPRNVQPRIRASSSKDTSRGMITRPIASHQLNSAKATTVRYENASTQTMMIENLPPTASANAPESPQAQVIKTENGVRDTVPRRKARTVINPGNPTSVSSLSASGLDQEDYTVGLPLRLKTKSMLRKK